jgi:putative ABC transport system permease protein
VLLSAGFGGLLAVWAVRVTAPFIPAEVPRAGEIDLDLRVLGFAVLASALTGVVVSLAPLWNASRVDVAAALQRATSTASQPRGARRFSGALVAGEIALAMMLLTGAALVMNSFARLNQTDPGFNPQDVLSFHLEWPTPAYPPARAAQAFDELKSRLEAVPGVRAASIGLQLPDRGLPLLDEALPLVEVTERPAAAATRQRTSLLRIQPGYFRAMGIPLVMGRDFDANDAGGTALVIIVNESLARAHFPGENPIGKHLTLESWSFFGRLTLEIVGVARDVAHRGLTTPPVLLTYLPLGQHPYNAADVVVRTEGNPLDFVSAVRATLRSLDPNIPISDIQILEGRIARSLAQDRFTALLLGVFSGLALLLAAGGLYGVLSYAVARRTHELGIRLVMGASVGDMLRLVLGHGMAVALAGIAIGMAGALALTRVVASLLFGVTPTDPPTFAAVTLLLVLVALVACWLPARRATRCDPIAALRQP